MPALHHTSDSPTSSAQITRFPLEDWAVRLLIGLSLIFTLVPTTLNMGALGPEAAHRIADGSMLRQIQFGSLFLIAAWLAWRQYTDTLGRLRAMNPFLGLLVLYCATSALWSPYPDLTLKRVVLFAGLILIGLAISPPAGGSRQFLRVVMHTLTLLVAVSAIVALLFPHIGVDYLLDGAWRGIMWQKNVLGSIAGFGLLLWLREWLSRPEHRHQALFGFLLCLFVLIMAKSATATLVTGLGICTYLCTRRPFIRGRHAGLVILLTLLLVAAYGLLAFFIATGRMPAWSDLTYPIATIFGKSTDLTGRSTIWLLVWRAMDLHPVWGIGYGAFWVGEGGPAQFIADQFGWMPSNAHNGYIDILNELGRAGFILFIGALLWHLRNLLALFRIDREDAAMHSAILLIILVSNFSESQLLRDVAFQQILFVYSSLTITGRLWQARTTRGNAAYRLKKA